MSYEVPPAVQAVTGPLTDAQLAVRLPLPVVSTGSNGVVDAGNSSTTPLAGGATFTGAWIDVLAYGQINVAVYADVASATDGLIVEWSGNGSTVHDNDVYTVPAANGQTIKFGSGWRYMRVRYVNGVTAQSVFSLTTIDRPAIQKSSTHRAADSVSDQQDTDLVTALVKARNPTTGSYDPTRLTPEGALQTGDSGELSYTPGLFGTTVTASGDTTVYTATSGKAFRIRSTYAVPVVRGSEDPPVITIKILNSSNVVVATPFVVAAVSKRKVITGPVNGKIAVSLDIAGRVPCTFDIEEF